jgi:hypothetical protein
MEQNERMEKLLNRYETDNLDTSTLIYAYFPVALGTRRVSNVAWYELGARRKVDQNKLPRDTLSSIEVMKRMFPNETRAIGILGLEMVELKPESHLMDCSKVPLTRYFIINKGDKKVGSELKNIKFGIPHGLWLNYAIAKNELLKDIRTVGEVLGYPKCCIEEFYADMEVAAFPEMRSQEQTRVWREKGREIDAFSYFAFGFIPCKPNCQEAAAIGHKIYESYNWESLKLAETYQSFLKNYSEKIEKDGEQTFLRYERRVFGI